MHHLHQIADDISDAMIFMIVGIFIAIGQMLDSREEITWRIALGRCITTGGFALVAGAALAFFPNLPFIAQIGISAMLASLGESGLELMLKRILKR